MAIMKTLSMAMAGAAVIALGIVGTPARAAVISFEGKDIGASPTDPRPNSDASAAAFDAAAGTLGSLNLIDFESLPVGNFNAIDVAPGVTVTLTNTSSDADAGITNVPGDNILGYNTTAGGNQFLRTVPIFDIGTVTVDFSFAQMIQAFGLYLTGLGTANGNLNVLFDDGTSQLLPVVGNPSGGVQFFGFTDAGKNIMDVSLQLSNVVGSRDIFGIDDVRFVSSTSVPEPTSTVAVLAFGALGASSVLKRKKEQKA
jgi:hypothetical protein